MSRARDWSDAANQETLTVDSTNNRVGIGTSSPSYPLTITSASDAAALAINGRSSDNLGVAYWFANDGTTEHGNIRASASEFRISSTPASAVQTFYTNGSEAMRIDSSGNLLVGRTSTINGGTNTTSGTQIGSNGLIQAAVSGDTAISLQRLTSDGDIIQFRKDNTTVGSIGIESAYGLYIDGESAHAGLQFIAAGVIPRQNGVRIDNAIDLGTASFRYDDVYATNGTIQTSDVNEKQQIATLTDAEITAAKAISALFKTYKWNSAVDEKGDAARTHTGVIAQDVQQAMTDAGLDAGDYAFFISSTWWEADATYTDDDGVEQTRTDTYDTAEEAPEGAVERTRLGVRYPELLAFVGAATEQRLANIETRLAALENV